MSSAVESLQAASASYSRRTEADQGVMPTLVHILAVPFTAQGHLNPMLRLAQALAAEVGVLVTFACPARFHRLALKRHQFLASAAGHSHACNMLRVEVVDDGLPLEEEQPITPQILGASVPVFQNAVKLLLKNLLHQSSSSCPPPSCIVSDTLCFWTQDDANAAAIPRVEFWTSTAAAYAMYCHLPSLIARGILPLPKSCWADSNSKWTANAPPIDQIPGLPAVAVTDLPAECVHAEEVSDGSLQYMLLMFRRAREAHTTLVHSTHELESDVLDALQAQGFPIHAVGPLLGLDSSTRTLNTSRHECLEWLDKHPPSSVTYVALGSLASLTRAELRSLALGLEAFGHPFLWVIRQDSITEDSLCKVLPEGFVQRTINQGLGLIVSWAPQTEVLRHGSIGAFFSHCGWNSTLESIWEGVPMVACPREAEQRFNARYIAETWKMGVDLERQVDGSFDMQAVQRALERVLIVNGGDEGQTYKDMALRVKKLARSAIQAGGSSHSSLVTFLQRLRKLPHS